MTKTATKNKGKKESPWDKWGGILDILDDKEQVRFSHEKRDEVVDQIKSYSWEELNDFRGRFKFTTINDIPNKPRLPASHNSKLMALYAKDLETYEYAKKQYDMERREISKFWMLVEAEISHKMFEALKHPLMPESINQMAFQHAYEQHHSKSTLDVATAFSDILALMFAAYESGADNTKDAE